MAYIGNAPVAGENNSFKILDDISSYTLTFDGSSASVVSTSDNTITYNSHRFITAQRVTYNDGGGTAIGGLADGVYYIIKNDQNTIKLAASEADANTGTAIPLTSLGVGSSHTLNVAFDGVNTKFKATYDNGTKAQISRAAQLMLSVNGVIQQPNDTTTPTNGFGFDLDSVIIFSVAPTATDSFWGNLVANNFPTFDISDNTIDSFTGDNSTVDFTLSKTPANNQNILVTLDGVVQYPSDATNTRAYSVTNNILTFVSAPGNGVAIQVRHIGFAGAVTSAVTGFYGRTGNVGLSTSDNAEVLTLKVGTGTTFTEDLVVQGNARVTGILTIGTASLTLDGTNNQIKIGTGITLTESGSADYTGIVTATGFVGNVTGDLTSSGVSTVGQLNVGTGGTIITTTAGGDINIDSGGVFYDATNNRLAIGTTSPGASLHVAGTGAMIRVGDGERIDLIPGANTNDPSLIVSSTGSALTFASNGASEMARLDTSGRLLVGTTTNFGSNAKFQVESSSATNSSYGIDIRNSANATLFAVRSDGLYLTGTSSLSPYNYGTAAAANMVVNSNGYLLRSTSSLRFKKNIETLEDRFADKVLECRPVWYQSKLESDVSEWGYWGFIAEEVEKVDPRLCFYGKDEEGNLRADGVQYDRFVPHLLNLIKRQKEQIEAMEARLSALEAQ